LADFEVVIPLPAMLLGFRFCGSRKGSGQVSALGWDIMATFRLGCFQALVGTG